ncbi:cytidylyltransferase domain-containing protein [Methanoculleus horonobensis]|uniref:cytidylyltransferase domain-containing protein n=1 Tax=Methanoculleus horonobensis TaxID=528314 RepID=UPI000832AD1E|nr:glycosyltransferase family protein [Methanoculleus horonobensis]
MHVVAIVQARMGSTRLPGKVMKDLLGKPVLTRAINRIRRAKCIDEVVIATTIKPEDDAIAALCEGEGWQCFRGSENDLLDRYYRAAQAFNADVVVRITSDCPMIDPEVIDKVIGEFLSLRETIDYASNTLSPRTFPRGLDVEVMTFEALEHAWREDNDPALREHVTPYIYQNPEIFRLHQAANEVDLSHHRWTLDTPEDLALIRAVYSHFGNDRFTWMDAIEYLDQHPEIMEINSDIKQKTIE